MDRHLSATVGPEQVGERRGTLVKAASGVGVTVHALFFCGATAGAFSSLLNGSAFIVHILKGSRSSTAPAFGEGSRLWATSSPSDFR
jgi:hypothetical protein